MLGPSPPDPSSLPNPATVRIEFGGALLPTGLAPNDVLDFLSGYNGPYIIYTSEIIGCGDFHQGTSNARHMQVFQNTAYV